MSGEAKASAVAEKFDLSQLKTSANELWEAWIPEEYRKLAAGGIAVSVVGAIVTLMLYGRGRRRSPCTDAELLALIRKSFALFETAPRKTIQYMATEINPVKAKILKRSTWTDPELSLSAAQFLLDLSQYIEKVDGKPHTAELKLDASAADIKKYLDKAWNILEEVKSHGQIEAGSSTQNNVDIFQLELGLKMQDPLRMTAAFEAIASTLDETFDETVLLMCFTFSCILGRWSLVRHLGEQLGLEKLEEFHAMAENDEAMETPDYEAVFHLAEGQAQDLPADQCVFKSVAIKKMEFKFISIECETEERAAELRKTQDESGEWVPAVVRPNDVITWVGALAQLDSRGEGQDRMKLVGPAGPGHLIVVGYRDLLVGDDNEEESVVRQTEMYELTESEEEKNVWIGTFQVSQNEEERTPGQELQGDNQDEPGQAQVEGNPQQQQQQQQQNDAQQQQEPQVVSQTRLTYEVRVTVSEDLGKSDLDNSRIVKASSSVPL
jgi:hypothetical protein